jgi:hypothetical protein
MCITDRRRRHVHTTIRALLVILHNLCVPVRHYLEVDQACAQEKPHEIIVVVAGEHGLYRLYNGVLGEVDTHSNDLFFLPPVI